MKIRTIRAVVICGLLLISSAVVAAGVSLEVAGGGGYQLSTVPGSQYDQAQFFPGGISGDAISKTVTVSGSGSYSRPLGAVYGNHSFDYSALFTGQGTASYGALSGAMSFDAQSHPDAQLQANFPPNPNFDNPIRNDGHASLQANMQLTFRDSGLVTSATLPNGSPITIRLTIASQAFSIYLGRPIGLDSNGNIDKAYGSGFFEVFDQTSHVTLNPSYGAGTIQSYNFNTTVGSRLDVRTEFDLNVGAFAGRDGSSPFSPFYPEVKGSIDASHTTKFFVDGTGDVSFVGDSGHCYALTPRPPAMAPSQLAATGVTTIPGGTGTFTILNGHAALGGGNLAFYGTGSAGQLGIYKSVAVRRRLWLPIRLRRFPAARATSPASA